jgi:glycosyltransferase involved in cell wall biosynthesis
MARRVVELAPGISYHLRPIIWRLLNDDESSANDIAWETRGWAAAHLVQSPLRDLTVDRARDRKLRLGFVSGDLRFHAVEKFARGMLLSFDRERFEVICYSTSEERDGVTDDLARHLELRFLGPSESRTSAEAIARDKIDILIDLAGLTDNSGLPWMGFKPAPIQVTFLGYPATTGCAAIDVRLSDRHADPMDLTDTLHSEELVRINGCAWNFAQKMTAPIYSREPNQPLIFGSFNRAMKLTTRLLAAWARILEAVPNARLLIKTNVEGDATYRRILGELERGGAGPDQVLILGWTPTYEAHQLNWNDVDIALDSFPYAGTTTTCEALLMGVPVVSLAGAAHVSRVGVSLLAQVGLSDLVAQDWDDYVATAVRLAADADRRKQLRTELPLRVRESMLGDSGRYCRELEAIFRALFNQFLDSPRAELFGQAIKVESQPPTWLRGNFGERGEGRTLGRLDLYDPVALAFSNVLIPGEPVHTSAWDCLGDLQVLARNHPLTVTGAEHLDRLRLGESLPPTKLEFSDLPAPGTNAFFGDWSFLRGQLLEPHLFAHLMSNADATIAWSEESPVVCVRPVPELGLLVPTTAPPTSQNLLVLGPERAASLRACGRLVDEAPPASGAAPVIHGEHQSLAHLEALGLAQAKLPPAVAFFLGALESNTPDAALSLANRALSEAVSDFADQRTLGSALTLARIAISLGEAKQALEALQWVLGPGASDGSLGDEAFLPCHPRYVDACLKHPRPAILGQRRSSGFTVFAPDPIAPETLAECAAREQSHPALKAEPLKRWCVQQAAECLLLHCLPLCDPPSRVLHTFVAYGGRSFNVARIFGLIRLTQANNLP